MTLNKTILHLIIYFNIKKVKLWSNAMMPLARYSRMLQRQSAVWWLVISGTSGQIFSSGVSV